MKKVFRLSILGLALSLGGVCSVAYAGTGYMTIANVTGNNTQIYVEAYDDKTELAGTAQIPFGQQAGPNPWYNYYYLTSTYDTLRVFYVDDDGMRHKCGNDIPPGESTIPVVGSDYRTYEITQCDANGIQWTIMPNN